MSSCHYSIVIPTLNERCNIEILLNDLDNCGLQDYEVIVVDEHSSDGTLAAVEDYGVGKPHIHGMFNEGKRGLGSSVVCGFRAARGRILCCMDGDLQHDVRDLCGLLKVAERYDMVVGSRYAAGGGFSGRWSFRRVLISRTAAMLSRLFLGVTISDPMSGFFAIRRDAFEKIHDEVRPSGYKIMLELLFLLTDECGGRVAEHGITFRPRIHGESKLSLVVMFDYVKMLLRLNRRRRQP